MDSKNKENFPWEIRKLDEKETSEATKYFEEAGFTKRFIRVGPGGYFYSEDFESVIKEIYNLELRSDDVFVVTFPKAGTTWTQELVWLVSNNFDYETAKTVPLMARFPFLEYSAFTQNETIKAIVKQACGEDQAKLEFAEQLSVNGPDLVAALPSPRFIKCHQPFSLLPPNILDKTKVIYVARDPRDIVVSFYHHHKMTPLMSFTGEFKDFWKLFKKNMIHYTPIFSHFREAWELKDHPNILIFFYEELSKDLSDVIRRVAKFLGRSATEEQIAGLCEHLKFDNFKANKAVNYDIMKDFGIINKDKNFVRKGKTGDWRDHFDEEMAKEAELWMEEGLKGIDFFKF